MQIRTSAFRLFDEKKTSDILKYSLCYVVRRSTFDASITSTCHNERFLKRGAPAFYLCDSRYFCLIGGFECWNVVGGYEGLGWVWVIGTCPPKCGLTSNFPDRG